MFSALYCTRILFVCLYLLWLSIYARELKALPLLSDGCKTLNRSVKCRGRYYVLENVEWPNNYSTSGEVFVTANEKGMGCSVPGPLAKLTHPNRRYVRLGSSWRHIYYRVDVLRSFQRQ